MPAHVSAGVGRRYNSGVMDWRERREQSAVRHGIKSWAVDTTYHISHIHVIESLDGGHAGKSGTRLFEALETLCHRTPVTPTFHEPYDKAALFDLLNRITLYAQKGQCPLLHLRLTALTLQTPKKPALGSSWHRATA
jgi:hypothetical protein